MTISGLGTETTTGQQSDPSFGELVAAASRDISGLVRAEIELAKAELSADLKAAAVAGAMFGVAAVFGVFLFAMLLIAFAEGLVAAGLWRWLAYLVVAGTLLLLAAVLGLVGARSIRRVRPPRRTLTTAKETVAWARHPTKAPGSVPR